MTYNALYHGSVQKNKAIYEMTLQSVQSLPPDSILWTTDEMGVCFWAAAAGISRGLKVKVLGASVSPKNRIDYYRSEATNLEYKQIGQNSLAVDIQNWLLTWAKEHDKLRQLDSLFVDEALLQLGLRNKQGKLHLLTDGINWRTYRMYSRALLSDFPMSYLLGQPNEDVSPLYQLL